MTNEQLIAIEMKPLEGCAAVLVSFNRPFTHVEMNAMHHALNEHLIPHASEPLPVASFLEQIKSWRNPYRTHYNDGFNYALNKVIELFEGTSRDASSPPAPEMERLTRISLAARALLKYLDDHDWGLIPEGQTANTLRDLLDGGCHGS